MTAELTTDSPASHYGIPVLRVHDDGTFVGDYGPADILPEQIAAAGGIAATAGYWVAAQANAGTIDREAARAFCAQWPDGPQPE